VKFLIDNQLPPALARFIETNLLCEAKHVADVDLREVSADSPEIDHRSPLIPITILLVSDQRGRSETTLAF
jgi:hypothetical protein